MFHLSCNKRKECITTQGLAVELVVGFEPTWVKPTDYKSVPIDLYGTPAYIVLHVV